MKKYWLFIILGVIVTVTIFLLFVRQQSHGVLDAFQTIEQRLEESNSKTAQRNDSLMKRLEEESVVQYEKVKQLDSISLPIENYIATLKERIQPSTETNYAAMQDSEAVDKLLFDGANPSEEGKEFIKQIDHFRIGIVSLFHNSQPVIADLAAENFSTQEVTTLTGSTKPWLEYHFKGFPRIAVITKLTQMQSDIRSLKTEAYNSLLGD